MRRRPYIKCFITWGNHPPIISNWDHLAEENITSQHDETHHCSDSASASDSSSTAASASEDTTRSSEQSPQWRHCHARWSRPTPSPPPATRRALPLLKYNRAINMSECFRCCRPHSGSLFIFHSRPMRNQMKLRKALKWAMKGKRLCFKDSKHILFEIVAF